LQRSKISYLELLSSLAKESDRRILLLVLDGVGGLPVQGKTELETARTPNLDSLARRASCGLSIPILPGVSPGSGPAHLALFGLDPLIFEIDRGALEVYGVGKTLSAGQIGARGNFCKTDKNGVVTDRRAGRLATDENARLCAYLNGIIKRVDDVAVEFVPGKEHRFVLILTGKGMNAELSDTDPHENMKHYAQCTAASEAAQKSASVVNSLMDMVTKALASEKEATGIILRGFSGKPEMETLGHYYKLKCACIATYPMYRGIASLLGMDVIQCGDSLSSQMDALKGSFGKYDFIYFHYKMTDMAGEDGDFKKKVRFIEEFDAALDGISGLKPDVLVVTGDHSTPSSMKKHSWHPNPFMLISENARMDAAERFTERECARGCLGVFEAKYAMGLMLAHADRLEKYGA
jgi:2,3-bisphosphoglycerate-independent phosphoglycerate mutase